jgi:hypothetical protein
MLYHIAMSIQDGVCLCGHIVFWISGGRCSLPLNRGCPFSNYQGANNAWVPFNLESRFTYKYKVLNAISNNILYLLLVSCGQTQTGSFLDAAAPNGLFGLGIDEISVPSILAKKGLASNSFSMCFGHDGIGRISFGDQGSSDQEETPLDIDPKQ